VRDPELICPSPTYLLHNEYEDRERECAAPSLRWTRSVASRERSRSISVHHYDLYRLRLGDDMSALELSEAIINGVLRLLLISHNRASNRARSRFRAGVTLIEWPDRLQSAKSLDRPPEPPDVAQTLPTRAHESTRLRSTEHPHLRLETLDGPALPCTATTATSRLELVYLSSARARARACMPCVAASSHRPGLTELARKSRACDA
jgi:tRNA A37 threonylcarbamoyladenosine biosynthesis protein TsaE